MLVVIYFERRRTVLKFCCHFLPNRLQGELYVKRESNSTIFVSALWGGMRISERFNHGAGATTFLTWPTTFTNMLPHRINTRATSGPTRQRASPLPSTSSQRHDSQRHDALPDNDTTSRAQTTTVTLSIASNILSEKRRTHCPFSRTNPKIGPTFPQKHLDRVPPAYRVLSETNPKNSPLTSRCTTARPPARS